MRSGFMKIVSMDKKTNQEVEKWIKYARISKKMVVVTYIILIAAIILKSLLNEDLPAALWIPWKNNLTFRIIQSISICYSFATKYVVISGDVLYIALCTDALVQFILLDYHFKTFDSRQRVELRKFVDHHNILLRYCSLSWSIDHHSSIEKTY